jgi:hypothetical protein
MSFRKGFKYAFDWLEVKDDIPKEVLEEGILECAAWWR